MKAAQGGRLQNIEKTFVYVGRKVNHTLLDTDNR